MSRRRVWCFRIAAMLLGLVPFVVLELGLRVGGLGHPEDTPDPFAEAVGVRPLFVNRAETGRFEIPGSRLTHFCAEEFAAQKDPREYRVFALGGSTVQGRPYASETSFTTWLELSLRAWDDSRPWKVVNCGGVSYATPRLVPMLREVLNYQPDMIVLYTGHNEFLERQSGPSKEDAPRWLVKAYGALGHCRTFNWLRSLWTDARGGAGKSDQKLAAEVDALLDYRGGLKDYERDDSLRAAVVGQFEHNLRRMVGMAARAGVPILLVDPVSNLRSCPPFKSVQRSDLSSAESAQFGALMKTARGASTSAQDRFEALRAAVALDPRHAEAQFRLGQALEARGAHAAARAAFIVAKDEDLCPLRMLESMHQIVRRVARDSAAELIDVRGEFVRRAPHGICGKETLVDHVHPSIEGHRRIAASILGRMCQLGVVGPAATGFAADRDRAFRNHARRLPPEYEMRAKQRLRGLQRWTEGRAFGKR